ncbi:MAG TPA: zinc ribbon domain-containing protein [Myxococcales bacterium]|jgi:putative FmdB family regulatory protein|nr:zinc ribbon domain-containing protein [Myxococcales bacterium]
MPIYEYVCKQCGKLTDRLQKVNDPPPEQCEGCGAQGTLNRVMSRTSFVLKGGGWYSDLYGTPKKDAKKDGEAPKSDAGSGSSDSASSSTGASSSSPAAASTPAPAASSSPSSSSSSSSEKK